MGNIQIDMEGVGTMKHDSECVSSDDGIKGYSEL